MNEEQDKPPPTRTNKPARTYIKGTRQPAQPTPKQPTIRPRLPKVMDHDDTLPEVNEQPTKRLGPLPGYQQVRTIMKQELGINPRDQMQMLGLFIKGAGAKRLIGQMKKITGYRYVMAWQIVAEYFFPKLSRTVIDIGNNNEASAQLKEILNTLPLDTKLQIAEAMQRHLDYTPAEVVDDDLTPPPIGEEGK